MDEEPQTGPVTWEVQEWPAPQAKAKAKGKAKAKAKGSPKAKAKAKTRRQYKKKAPEPERPLTVQRYLPPCFTATLPLEQEESRLSRELGTAIHAVDFGAAGRKPAVLRPLLLGPGGQQKTPLHLVGGKEDGETYYCSQQLDQSPTARVLLRVSGSKSEAYSRMPLLRTPSRHVAWPEGCIATRVPDKFVGKDATTGGQSEISPGLARALGMLKEAAWRNGACT